MDLDAKTPRVFDPVYYTKLKKKKRGLLSTDQFMAKLGNIEVLMDQNEGDIRSKYSFVNAY